MRKRTLERLQEIDELGNNQQQIVREVKDEEVVSGDPILLELNRMFR